MGILPSGTVTFLFTDIESSTKLWQAHPHQMEAALKEHDSLLKNAIESNNGYVFKTVGDAFCGAFPTAMDGLNAALAAQLQIKDHVWDTRTPIKVRMAIHTGEAVERNKDYYGPALNRVARLESIGYGGQTLLSLVTAELVRDMLPEDISLRDMGEHRLKDLTRPEGVYQLEHPELPDEFPPLKSLDKHPNNLPIQPTPLIGRETLLAKLCTSLTPGASSVITLTGTGGIGKTRLALQGAADTVDAFEDGVFFVDLAFAGEIADVYSTIASALNIKESEGGTLRESVTGFLSRKKMLLVLDNLEQIEEAGKSVSEIRSKCPGVAVLVTSRHSLNLKGEHVISVPPLPVPKKVKVAPEDINQICQYESVRLFIERAGEHDDGFQISRENAAAIAEICVTLDGIPLAIELASARIGVLSPEQLLERLSDRFSILSHGASDLPVRQQTLQTTIDWSYSILTEGERTSFLAVSVFQNGFTLEAAEQVFAKTGLEIDVLDTVTSLFEKSMLVRYADGNTTPRFGTLETLRMYGRQHYDELKNGEAVKTAHADYYRNISYNFSLEIEGENQLQVGKLYLLEFENIRSSFRHYVARNDARCAEVILNMWRYCRSRGIYTETRECIAQVFNNGIDIPIKTTAKLLLADGVLARCQGDLQVSRRSLQRGLLEMYRIGEETTRNDLLYELGWTYFRMNKLNLAEDLFQRSLASSKKIKNRIGTGLAYNGLGTVAIRTGNDDTAETFLLRSVKIFSGTGEIRQYALTLGNYALVLRLRGKRQRAVKFLKSAVEAMNRIGERDQIKVFLNNIAFIYHELGGHEHSMDYYQKLRKVAMETDDPVALSNAHAGICEYYLKIGDLEKSKHHAECARRQVLEMGTSPELGTSLRLLAEVSLKRGDTPAARMLFKKSIEIFETARETEELEKAKNGLARCG